MSDEDRTVDADASTMDELRRLAAAAKTSAESGSTDHTVQADDSTMDELRKFAEQARRQAREQVSSFPPPSEGADHTVGADPSVVDELRRLAHDVQLPAPPPAEMPTVPEAAKAPGLGPLPNLSSPELLSDGGQVDTGSLPDLPTAVPEPAWSSSASVDQPDHTTARLTDVRPSPGTPTGKIEGWRPPPRMVMPTEPEKRTEVHHGPWRAIAMLLAVAVVALVGFVVFGAVSGGDDDAPSDDSVPGLDLEPAEEGSSG